MYRHYDFNGGLQKFITEDNSTCLEPPEAGAALEPPAWGGTHTGEEVIPCDVANDLKEVPGACAGMKWPGWGPRCKRQGGVTEQSDKEQSDKISHIDTVIFHIDTVIFHMDTVI